MKFTFQSFSSEENLNKQEVNNESGILINYMFTRLKKPIIYTTLGLFLMIILGVVILQHTNYLDIKYIILNDNILPDPEKNTLLQNANSKSLLIINTDQIIKNIQNKYHAYSVVAAKKYPDTLIINILDTQLIAYLYIDHIKKPYLFGLNDSGKIITNPSINPDQISNLRQPVIYYHHSIFKLSDFNILKAGSIISNNNVKSILKSLYLIKKLNSSFYNKIHLINISGSNDKNYLKLKELKTLFHYGDELSVLKLMKILSIEEDITTKISFRKIDLRFQNVIGIQ